MFRIIAASLQQGGTICVQSSQIRCPLRGTGALADLAHKVIGIVEERAPEVLLQIVRQHFQGRLVWRDLTPRHSTDIGAVSHGNIIFLPAFIAGFVAVNLYIVRVAVVQQQTEQMDGKAEVVRLFGKRRLIQVTALQLGRKELWPAHRTGKALSRNRVSQVETVCIQECNETIAVDYNIFAVHIPHNAVHTVEVFNRVG